MWLGKALFLKGEDRREQALQEYREGVRVLEESKTDRRSPSMALFRWYLGKALLENNEVTTLRRLEDAKGTRPGYKKRSLLTKAATFTTGDAKKSRSQPYSIIAHLFLDDGD